MKGLLTTLGLFVACTSKLLAVELLPPKTTNTFSLAFPRELTTGVDFDSMGQWTAHIGTQFPLIGVGALPYQFQLGIEGAGYFNLRKEGERFPLETTDGYFGAYGVFQIEAVQLFTKIDHQSSHLSDGSTATPIAYSREWIHVGLKARWWRWWEIYSAFESDLHVLPLAAQADRLILGSHFFLFSPERLAPNTSIFEPYLGIDYRLNLRNMEQTQLSLVAGARMQRDFARDLRFYYRFFTGQDYRGQYYNQFISVHSVGFQFVF